jgi:hypothetical protein
MNTFGRICGTIDPGSCIRWVHGFGIKTGYDIVQGGRVWSHGARHSTRALPNEAAGSDTAGHATARGCTPRFWSWLGACIWGYPVCRVLTTIIIVLHSVEVAQLYPQVGDFITIKWLRISLLSNIPVHSRTITIIILLGSPKFPCFSQKVNHSTWLLCSHEIISLSF